jgi:pantoate--beta-alanine ligase
MKILLNNNDLNEALKNVSNLGFVPTMGSIHKGHISLINNSKKNCQKTIVSIFINPNQFNKKIDFEKYPRNIKKDLSILKRLKVNFLYLPNINHIYNFKRKKRIKLALRDNILCAKFRKGHFEGVIDVMDRLTKLINPKKIFMGEKDFQQLHLVKRFVEKKYKTKVISCKTIRDKNKLALSSRNLNLKKKELFKAGKLTQELFSFKRYINNKKDIKNMKNVLIFKKYKLKKTFEVKIEYLNLRNKFDLRNSNKTKNSKLFIAYYINKVRLIDNV